MHLHKHLLFLLLLFDFFQSTRFKKKNALSSNPIDMKSLGDHVSITAVRVLNITKINTLNKKQIVDWISYLWLTAKILRTRDSAEAAPIASKSAYT